MSVLERDHIAARYEGAFLADAQTVVTSEINALFDALSTSYLEDWVEWVQEIFYPWLAQLVESTFYQSITFYFEALSIVIEKEITEALRLYGQNLPFGWDADSIRNQFKRDYLQRFGVRWADSSVGQMVHLAETAPEEISGRLSDWSEVKAERVKTNEIVRSASGVFTSLVFGAGLQVRWVIRGPETCQYCQTLNGRTIGKYDYFQEGGDKVQPEGMPPMRIRHRIQGPPLHRK
jgi:hypothetical protein